MNTESISAFTTGLLAGAGLTLVALTGSYFVTTIVVDRNLAAESHQHIQDAQAIWEERSAPEDSDSE